MTQPAPTKSAAYAWAAVGLLWPVALLNYLDRQMLSTIRASVRADIPTIANDQDFGTLMAVFMWVYAFMSPVGGYAADRFNRRWTVIGSLFVWSGATWLTGQVQTYSQMLWCRGAMGFSEAFYMPAALALIVDFHSPTTQARAVGIHQSGIYCGLALGGIGGYVAQMGSWRHCFTWFGAVGVSYAVVLAIALRDAPTRSKNALAPPSEMTPSGICRALWGNPSFWLLAGYFTLPAIAGWLTKNWLPTFLADAFALKQGPAGLSATGYIQLASLAGVIGGGMLADHWMKTQRRGRIFTSALGVLALSLALLGVGCAWSMGVAIIFLILFGLGWGFFDSNNMPILCQIVRPEHRATGYGFMNFVSISVGGGATVLLGWMRDHQFPFASAFAAAGLLALLSIALVLLVKPKEPAPEFI